MSFQIALIQPGRSIAATVLRRHERWSTVAASEPATVEVAYELGTFFPFAWLDRKAGHETIAELRDAVLRLGVRQREDWTLSTPGNAGAVCAMLLSWACEYPEAVWQVDR